MVAVLCRRSLIARASAQGARRDAATAREHLLGRLEHWPGSTPFLTRGLARVKMEMSSFVLIRNLKRVIWLVGTPKTLQAMRSAPVSGY